MVHLLDIWMTMWRTLLQMSNIRVNGRQIVWRFFPEHLKLNPSKANSYLFPCRTNGNIAFPNSNNCKSNRMVDSHIGLSIGGVFGSHRYETNVTSPILLYSLFMRSWMFIKGSSIPYLVHYVISMNCQYCLRNSMSKNVQWISLTLMFVNVYV